MDALAEAVRAEARRRVDEGCAAPVAPADTLALAWALKDICYEAWASEPARAARAAEVLGALSSQGLPVALVLQVQGLAAWTAGIACATRGEMAPAVAAFDHAAAALLQAGLPDPAAQTQVPKIMALSMLGQHEQATACAEAAQRTLLALGNLAAAGRVGLNLGALLLRRDAYAEAAHHSRQAAVLFARQGDHLHSVLADINLAGALTSLGDFDEALRIYARVRMRAAKPTLARSQPLTQALAMVDESVALVDLARGRYREALAGLESARRGFEALGLPHARAIAEKQLGDAYLDLHLLPEALALFDAAVADFARLQLPEEQAAALAQRGRAQALLGRAGAAAASLAAAGELFAAQDHAVGLSGVTLAQAELALVQGDSTSALAQAEAAAAGFGRAGQADGHGRAEVVRAQALWQCGQAVAAQAVFQDTLVTARQRQQLQVQVRCLTGQGIAAQAAGQPQVALAALEAAIELLEDQRRALPGDELRSAFLTDHLRPYQERLRLALAGGDAGQVLQQLERYRARSLAERLDEGRDGECGADAAAGDQARAEGDPELRERLHWLVRHVRRLHEQGEHSAALHEELLRTERELLERARRRRLATPVGAVVGPQAFSVQVLQAALAPTDALLAYGVLDDELFAVVVRHERVQVQRRLASWAQVMQALQSARFQIETLRHGLAPVQAHLQVIAARTQARLRQLHGLLWAPLRAALHGCERVLVVPQGQLSALPFAALGDGDLPLGQCVQLAFAPSAWAALRGLQRQPVAARSVLALGDSSRLPHAAREVQFVAGLFARGQALVAEQATLAALQRLAKGADVIHLACHAQFRGDNPRFSALHLHDGALTVEMVERLQLRPATVVLSACETGLSDDSGGGEMVGLVRAFLVAGAARVLATLWPVDDQTTADFMADFHARLVHGSTPARALQQAQAALRQRHPEPCFWAAFTLYGGW